MVHRQNMTFVHQRASIQAGLVKPLNLMWVIVHRQDAVMYILPMADAWHYSKSCSRINVQTIVITAKTRQVAGIKKERQVSPRKSSCTSSWSSTSEITWRDCFYPQASKVIPRSRWTRWSISAASCTNDWLTASMDCSEANSRHTWSRWVKALIPKSMPGKFTPL